MTSRQESLNLEAMLQNYGRQLDQAIGDTIEGGVPAPFDSAGAPILEPDPTTLIKRRSSLVLVCVALAALASLGALAIGGRGTPEQVLASETSSSSDTRPPFTSGFREPELVDLCFRGIEEEIQRRPQEHLFDAPIPNRAMAEVQTVVIPIDSPELTIFIADDGRLFGCIAWVETDGTAHVEPYMFGAYTSIAIPPAGEVSVVTQIWTSSSLQTLRNSQGVAVGPGTFSSLGRVGSDVVKVDAVLPDGSVLPGAVKDGWYRIDGRISDDVAMTRERIRWTLESGKVEEVWSLRLNQESHIRQCVDSSVCLNNRLDELINEARNIGADTQFESLSDRVITEDEYGLALGDYVTCLVDSGIDASLLGTAVTFSWGPPRDDIEDLGGVVPVESEDQVTARWEIESRCDRLHLGLVSEARSLAEAIARQD